MPSLENFSCHRGFTNLEKTFHIEGGEDFIYVSSGQVQTHEIKPSGSEVVLMDSFYRPWRSGYCHHWSTIYLTLKQIR